MTKLLEHEHFLDSALVGLTCEMSWLWSLGNPFIFRDTATTYLQYWGVLFLPPLFLNSFPPKLDNLQKREGNKTEWWRTTGKQLLGPTRVTTVKYRSSEVGEPPSLGRIWGWQSHMKSRLALHWNVWKSSNQRLRQTSAHSCPCLIPTANSRNSHCPMSINRGVDKGNVRNMYAGLLLSQKTGSSDKTVKPEEIC